MRVKAVLDLRRIAAKRMCMDLCEQRSNLELSCSVNNRIKSHKLFGYLIQKCYKLDLAKQFWLILGQSPIDDSQLIISSLTLVKASAFLTFNRSASSRTPICHWAKFNVRKVFTQILYIPYFALLKYHGYWVGSIVQRTKNYIIYLPPTHQTHLRKLCSQAIKNIQLLNSWTHQQRLISKEAINNYTLHLKCTPLRL